MFFSARRSAITLLAFACGAVSAHAQGWQHLGSVQRVEKLKDGVELTAGRARLTEERQAWRRLSRTVELILAME